MRAVGVPLVLVLLLLPTAAAGSTVEFAASASCGAPPRGPLVWLDGCEARQAGTAAVASCAARACTLTFAVEASATTPEAPATLTVVVDGDGGPTRVCADAGSGGALACSGTATVTLVAPSGCRHVVVETTASVAGVAGARAASELVVCLDGSVRRA